MNRSLRSALFLVPACLLMGCAEHALPPSGSHPTTPPEAIQLYQTEPYKYELIGKIVMPVTPEMKWDENGDSTLGFEALKAKASAMGANGVLLMQKNGGNDLSVGAGYKGKKYLVPMMRSPRTVVADAIYVIEK